MKPAVLVTMQLPPAAMCRLEQHAAVTTGLDQSDPRFAAALAGAEGMLINPRTVVFLCSPLASYITGADLRIDGGVVPAL